MRRDILRHVAAGLLGSFISRNNDIGGYWALGVLCAEAGAHAVELRLTERLATPPAPACMAVAATYAGFLRRAMLQHGIDADDLARATVDIAFGVVPEVPIYRHAAGAPFCCTVTLASRCGKTATVRAHGHCLPHDPALESQRRKLPS